MIDRPGPACIEFSLVKRDPLLDEPFRAPGEITVENPSAKGTVALSLAARSETSDGLSFSS
jgi:hypothetical protein